MARGSSVARAVTWLMLAGYGLVVSGLPLPVGGSPPSAGSAAAKRLGGKDRARPFPCMDKPCGCATAEQCFANCCCNTPTELLAWAEAHRLDPATLAALRKRAAAPASAASACCATASEAPSCCAAAAPACGCAPAATDPQSPIPAVPDDEPAPPELASPRAISLKAMLTCGGILAGWSAATTSLPAPPIVRVERAAACCGLIVLADEIGISIDRVPDAPPPRA